MTRVLIADDHPAFCRGVELMLAESTTSRSSDTPRPANVRSTSQRSPPPTSSSWTCACPTWTASRPPGGSAARTPAPAVVVLTMFEDDDSVFAAMRAGARGYLLKGADQDEIVRAIRAAAAGEAIFGPEIATRVISHFASGSGSTACGVPRADRPRARGAGDGRGGQGQRDRSRTSWSSALRPCATTCRTSSPSCRSPTDPQRSSRLEKPGSPRVVTQLKVHTRPGPRSSFGGGRRTRPPRQPRHCADVLPAAFDVADRQTLCATSTAPSQRLGATFSRFARCPRAEHVTASLNSGRQSV